MSPLVPIEKLADVWPHVSKWLERAIERNQGDENIWDVFVALARGTYILWYEPGAYATVVYIFKHPRQTVATVLYCGGDDLGAIVKSFEFGKQFARENKIDVIRVWGREGWEKALGLERVGVIMQVKP